MGAGHLRRKFNIRLLYIPPDIFETAIEQRAGPRGGGREVGKRATREDPAQPTTYPARFARAGRRAWEREVCVWSGLSIRLLSLRSSFCSVKPGRRRGLDRVSGGGCCARTAAAALMPVRGTSSSSHYYSSPFFCGRCSSRNAGEVCNKSLSLFPPPLPLSLSLFLAGSKCLVFACSCCEHCVCAFVISEVQCSEV